MAKLDEGFVTTVTFAGGGSQIEVELYEKEVTPPGFSGGGPIDTSTMRNTKYRTKVPRGLFDTSPASMVVAYDTALYDEIMASINVNQSITITFSDSSTLVFYGWIDEFTPNALTEGDQPTANMTIIASNQTGGVETDPVWSA